MTRAIATAFLGIGLCLAAATFDSPSLYVPGVALALLAAGAAIWVPLAARGATLTRSPGPPRVVEDEPYPLRVELRTGLLPGAGRRADRAAAGLAGVDRRPLLAARADQRALLPARAPRLEPGRLVIRDPLRMCERVVIGEGEGEVLVLPRVEPVTAPGGGGAGAGAEAGIGAAPGLAGRRLDASTAELEIDGLRAYREGSPASRIHWPTVARRGEMVERRLVAELDSAPLVVLDCSAPASEEALDMAVRAAGSLCVHLARSSGCAILLPGERRPVEIGHDLGAWPSVHVRLALAEPGPQPPAAALAPRSGAVLWVTAADLAGVPRALERLPAAARFVVTPERPAGSVGGLRGRGLQRLQAGPGAAGGWPHERRARPAAAARRRHRAARSPAPGRPRRARDTLPLRLATLHRPRRVRRRPLGGPRGRRAGGPHAPSGGGGDRGRRGARAARPRPAPAAGGAGAGARSPRSRCSRPRSARPGLSLRLLGPRGWDELADGLTRGLEGVQTIDWPYAGPDEWIRLTILLGAPALMAAAAALAFFPVRRGARVLRLGGLVLLLVLYGTAVTEHDPGAPLLRGFVLLVLVGAWLWLPRLTLREGLVGAAVIASVGILSVPVAAAFDAERPWWNYRDWQWFGDGRAVTFDWTHSYGPLDWPREGTTLLNIKSDRPHYWKVETLDGFDGFRWLRTDASSPSHELPGPAAHALARGPDAGTTTSTTRAGTRASA